MRPTATKIWIAATALALLLVALPASASAVVLFDQTGSPGSNYTASMDYPPPNDAEAADDFTVPAGQQWTINEVDVLGTGGSFKTHVVIYADTGGLPGAVVFNADGLTATNGPNFNSVLPTPAVLGPGTYWLSVRAPDFWSWRDSKTDSGKPAVWQNPSLNFVGPPVTGCGKTWTTRSTCYENASEPGQAFKLLGPDPVILPTTTTTTKPSNAFTLGAFKKDKKKGIGTLTVNLPGPGTLSLSGAGLKPVTLAVAAAGDVGLTLKATGKAKKKLKKKGKAKVTATVVFTPTGGDAATQTKAVTLKKKKKPPPK